MLAQHDFQLIPEAVRLLCERIFNANASTVLVENALKTIKDNTRASNNGRCSRLHRLYVPVTGSLLEEFALKGVSSKQEVPREALRTVPKAAFEAAKYRLPLSDADVKTLLEGGEFPSPSASHSKTLVAAWLLLKHCSKTDSWQHLPLVWQ
eukprot:6462179-Amphidinium_carterae.1